MTSTRAARGPRVSPWREAAPAWAMIGIMAAAVAVFGVIWLGGNTASWITGHGFTGPEFGFSFPKKLFTDGGVETAWPAVSPSMVWGATGGYVVVIGVVLVALLVRVADRRATANDPLAALATPEDVASLTPAGVRRSALSLRPSLREQYQ